MEYVLAISLFSCGVLAFYFGVRFIWIKEGRYIENHLFTLLCFASAIWSFGFGGIILQTDPDVAYYWRAFGMIGVFSYLIFGIMLVCRFSELKKGWRYFIQGISYTGVVVYFFSIKKDQVVYYLSDKVGLTYQFKPGLANGIYTTYSVVVAVGMLFVIIHMVCCSKKKGVREFGKKFLLAVGILVFGMLFDTIFPMIGSYALPGSSFAQFFGLVVLHNAVHYINRSRINISNMSEFIYYSLAMPVLVYDSDKKLQILNDAAYSFFEIDKERTNIENMKINYLFSLKEEEVFEFEGKQMDLDAVCRKNHIYCNLAISEITDKYGETKGYIILVTDLSERMKTVQELEVAIKEAESANQAKSTFLANMSHEIRTPMHAILGFSELILKMDIADDVREYVEDIKWSSHNLLAIINDILDISKIESGKMELVCGEYYTATLFNDVSLIIATQAKQKGLEFGMNVDENIPRKMFGDKIRIRGVLINLLNNAVKYTKKGSVNFEVNILQKTDDNVTLEFRVIDTGIGIRKEDMGVLFQSFEQLDRKVHYGIEGSGLGLAIVKGYVTLMGGEVKVESVYGEGSVFTAVIEQKIVDARPIGKSFAESGEVLSEKEMGNLKISGVRVLVVDDNLVNLKVANKCFGYYGLDVDTASSGREAIELCKKDRYQLVFMDQMMPEMDGIEAMKEIRKLSPYYDYDGECKIIVLTADAISGVRDHLMEEGFDEYLGKPLNYTQLERLLIRFLPPENISRVEEEKKQQKEPDVKSEELEYLKTELSGIEVDKAILNCGGTVEDYLRILQIAYQYGEKQLGELRELQKVHDYKNYTIKIHSMKSTALNMGATELSVMARKQEEAGLKETYAYIDANMEEFQEKYRLFLKKIESVLKHYHLIEEPQAVTEKELLEEEFVIRILKSIDASVEEFEFTKVFAVLEEVENYQLPEAYREVFAEIHRYMDDLEVDRVKEVIADILKGKESEEN